MGARDARDLEEGLRRFGDHRSLCATCAKDGPGMCDEGVAILEAICRVLALPGGTLSEQASNRSRASAGAAEP